MARKRAQLYGETSVTKFETSITVFVTLVSSVLATSAALRTNSQASNCTCVGTAVRQFHTLVLLIYVNSVRAEDEKKRFSLHSFQDKH